MMIMIKFLSESSDDDSFYKEFPGQHIKKVMNLIVVGFPLKIQLLIRICIMTAPPQAKQAVSLMNMKKLNTLKL